MGKILLFLAVISTLTSCSHAEKRDLASMCQQKPNQYYDFFYQYERCKKL